MGLEDDKQRNNLVHFFRRLQCTYHVMCYIRDQHVAVQFIASIEAVHEAIAAFQATVAHGQSRTIVSCVFLGILIARMRQ